MRTRETPTKPSVVRPKKLLKDSDALSSKPFFRPSCLGFSKSEARAGDRVCVEGRNQNRDRNSDGELLVHTSGDSGNCRSRDKDCRQDERNGDHRGADLLHRFFGGGLGVHSFVDMVLDRFNNDDGIIDDQADGKDQAEQREAVDGEAEYWKNDKRANERHRDGQ